MSDHYEELRPPGGAAPLGTPRAAGLEPGTKAATRRIPRRRRRGRALLPKRWSSRVLLASAAVALIGAAAIGNYARVALADLPSPATDPLLQGPGGA